MSKTKEPENVAVAEAPKPPPYRKAPQMHDADGVRLRRMLRLRGDAELPPNLVAAYFDAQRDYHQRMQGALPLDLLADLVKECCGISVYLPEVQIVDENSLGGGDRIASGER